LREKEAATKSYEANAFVVSKEDAQYALSVGHVSEAWLTKPGDDYKPYEGMRRAFLTLWLSKEMGEELTRRSRPFPP
jgi:hypothetical protein